MARTHFERLVAEALDSLPEDILQHMDNVEVIVEDWPSRAQMARAGLGPGYTLFGLYEGVPLTKRSSSYGLVPPDKITIFRGPIEVTYTDEDERRRCVVRTVIHEIAHHFGLDEDRLQELGL